MNRRQEREQAFILIFEKSFNNELSIDDIIALAIETEIFDPSEFAVNLAKKTIEEIDEIDNLIESVSIGWNKDRMSKVALSILRIAICEMKYFDDIPVSVSINEAVELSKTFAGKDDSSFINGVLGTIARAPENN